MDNDKKYKHIPLSEDFYNWWYKGRKRIINLMLSDLIDKKNSKNLEILAIGPGVGVNIEVLQKFGKVSVLDVDEYFLNLISKNKKLKIENFYKDFNEINKQFDLVVFMDVIEHIEDHKKFIKNIEKIMKENSYGILSVPAYASFFSGHDEMLNHYRRYDWELVSQHLGNQFDIKLKFGFNYFLLPVRYIQIKFLTTPKFDTTTNFFMNFILNVLLLLEFYLIKININPKFGLSLFALFRKKSSIIN